MRKKMTAKQAKDFTSNNNRPVAKKKADRKIGDSVTKEITTHKKTSTQSWVDDRGISGGQIRGMAGETMARVYAEMWPGMQTHDEDGNVEVNISEEAYILMLTMKVGNGDYSPRRGLKIREAKMPTMKFCAAHKE